MNRVHGTHRQKLKSLAGEDIERGYLYLTPKDWDELYVLCTRAGMPTGKYIATLINAASGQSDTKENDGSARKN